MAFDLAALDAGLYRSNALRTLGLLGEVGRKEIKKRKNSLKTDLEMHDEEAVRAQVVGRFIGLPDEFAIRDAENRLDDPAQRLLDEIFWFRLDGPDDPTSDLLRKGKSEITQALETWLKAERDTASAIATQNLAVLHHFFALELETRLTDKRFEQGNEPLKRKLSEYRDHCWRQALVRWRCLFAEPRFWEWVRGRAAAIGNGRLEPSAIASLERELPTALLAINGRLALKALEGRREADARRHKELLSAAGFAPDLINHAMAAAAAPLRQRIRERIEAYKPKVKADPKGAGELTVRLLDDLEPALAQLDALLPEGNRELVQLHDQLVEAANIGQVIYSEATEDWPLVVRVLERLVPHVRAPTLRDVITKNLKATRSNREYASCFFCKTRPKAEGSEFEVKLYRDVSYDHTLGAITANQMVIGVPRCRECATAHRGQSKDLLVSQSKRFVGVREELEQGWKVGEEPTEEEIQQAILRNPDVPPELKRLVRDMPPELRRLLRERRPR